MPQHLPAGLQHLPAGPGHLLVDLRHLPVDPHHLPAGPGRLPKVLCLLCSLVIYDQHPETCHHNRSVVFRPDLGRSAHHRRGQPHQAERGNMFLPIGFKVVHRYAMKGAGAIVEGIWDMNRRIDEIAMWTSTQTGSQTGTHTHRRRVLDLGGSHRLFRSDNHRTTRDRWRAMLPLTRLVSIPPTATSCHIRVSLKRPTRTNTPTRLPPRLT